MESTYHLVTPWLWYTRSWAHNQSLAALHLNVFDDDTWDKWLDGAWTSSGSPLILIHIQISLAVGPDGDCLIGLDRYTFFYSKRMGAFKGKSKSVYSGVPYLFWEWVTCHAGKRNWLPRFSHSLCAPLPWTKQIDSLATWSPHSFNKRNSSLTRYMIPTFLSWEE